MIRGELSMGQNGSKLNQVTICFSTGLPTMYWILIYYLHVDLLHNLEVVGVAKEGYVVVAVVEGKAEARNQEEEVTVVV